MIATLLLMLQQPVAPPAASATPPIESWAALPVFPLPRAAAAADASAYVRAEVEAGRCQAIAPVQADGARVISPVVILVGDGGGIRRIVPRAINCPTIEQYTVGYLLSLTRGAPGSMRPPAPGWYRLTITYRW